MNEFEFIETLRRRFSGIGDAAIEGIGDDCAVIPVGDGSGEAFVVTTDMLIEGVHFLRDKTSAKELGGKALAVNLSDVAAMGARPVASFLSVALPAECRGEWAAEFTEGYAQISERYGVKPAGGDTTSSLGAVSINVAVVGRAPIGNLKFRRSARPGDVVAVAGMLGASAAGLAEILNDADTASGSLSRQIHNNPTPQVEEGAWFGTRTEVHAMMDLSDGLASDLVHILRASSGAAGGGKSGGKSFGAEIELTAIPTETTLEYAINGGEDYKLLLTVDAAGWEGLARDFLAAFGTPLYPIGRIVDSAGGAGKITWMENKNPVRRDWTGFLHF